MVECIKDKPLIKRNPDEIQSTMILLLIYSQVSKCELPLVEMKQRYPQIVGFHFISTYTGQVRYLY